MSGAAPEVPRDSDDAQCAGPLTVDSLYGDQAGAPSSTAFLEALDGRSFDYVPPVFPPVSTSGGIGW